MVEATEGGSGESMFISMALFVAAVMSRSILPGRSRRPTMEGDRRRKDGGQSHPVTREPVHCGGESFRWLGAHDELDNLDDTRPGEMGAGRN